MTINIDRDACAGCGACSEVCPGGIIEPMKGTALPYVPTEKEGQCLSCGQCEAFCPTGALVQGDRTGTTPASPFGALSAEQLGLYLKSRRSVRQYRSDPVPRETIEALLEIARYAPSGGNGQPVEWLVIHDPDEVRKVAALVVDWMRELARSGHPMAAYIAPLVAAWDRGTDMICRGAPHLLVAHVPAAVPTGLVDAVIALTHVDLAAPSFGLGTCWAGFVAMACQTHLPLQEYLALPPGRVPAYAMMLGYPRYRPHQVPGRKPVRVTWREECR